MLLKQKVVKLILDELNIKPNSPFSIEGESTPYRLSKEGNITRYLGGMWIDSGYCYYDLIVLVDHERIKVLEENFEDEQEIVVKRRKTKK